MIERYTIKFGPAVSHKELEKALHTEQLTVGEDNALYQRMHRMKARIEIIGDFEDLKKLSEYLKQLKNPGD